MRQYWGNHYISYSYRKPWKKYRLLNIPIPDRIHHYFLNRGWISQRIDQFFDEHIQQVSKQLQQTHKFDAVVVNYVFFSKALNYFPDNVLKIIDTHDVYTDRHKRLLKTGLRPEWFFTSRTEEEKGLKRANRVIAIQSKEARIFDEILSRKTEVITVGHLFDPPAEHMINPIQDPLRFGIIASNNLLNAQALDWLIENVLEELPDSFTLKVWGSVCESIPSHPKLRKMGVVENITSAYQEADVFINPMQWGTGLKIKTLEALSYGRLIISTTCGMEGIEGAESEGCWVENEKTGWIRRINELISSTRDYSNALRSNILYTNEYLNENKNNLRQLFCLENTKN